MNLMNTEQNASMPNTIENNTRTEIELVPLKNGKPILRIRIPSDPQPVDQEDCTPFTDDEVETPSPTVFRAPIEVFVMPRWITALLVIQDWISTRYSNLSAAFDPETKVLRIKGSRQQATELMDNSEWEHGPERYVFNSEWLNAKCIKTEQLY